MLSHLIFSMLAKYRGRSSNFWRNHTFHGRIWETKWSRPFESRRRPNRAPRLGLRRRGKRRRNKAFPGNWGLPSGKSPFLMGKLTISMAIFNSYVSLPEGISQKKIFTDFVMRFTTMKSSGIQPKISVFFGHVPARKGQKQEQTGWWFHVYHFKQWGGHFSHVPIRWFAQGLCFFRYRKGNVSAIVQ